MKEIKQRFCQQLGDERVRFEEPMCDHTTFRIGGPAEVFVMPESYEQIAWVIRQCRQAEQFRILFSEMAAICWSVIMVIVE